MAWCMTQHTSTLPPTPGPPSPDGCVMMSKLSVVVRGVLVEPLDVLPTSNTLPVPEERLAALKDQVLSVAAIVGSTKSDVEYQVGGWVGEEGITRCACVCVCVSVCLCMSHVTGVWVCGMCGWVGGGGVVVGYRVCAYVWVGGGGGGGTSQVGVWVWGGVPRLIPWVHLSYLKPCSLAPHPNPQQAFCPTPDPPQTPNRPPHPSQTPTSLPPQNRLTLIQCLSPTTHQAFCHTQLQRDIVGYNHIFV